MNKRILSIVITAVLLAMPVTAVYSSFGLNLGMNYNTVMVEGEDDLQLIGISLQPDLEFGNWGIGLDVTLNFKLDGDDFFEFYKEDWVPEFGEEDGFLDKTKTVAELYLPIFRYVRYGHKGDPLYGQIGMFDSYTLGTGVFVDRYTNTRFVPQRRLTGLVLDIDGQLFNFPYVGLEMMTGNISRFDVMGARLYTRPLAFLDIPVIRNIQVGGSYVTDRDPGLYVDDEDFDPDAVQFYGADLIMPLIPLNMFTLDLFADVAFQRGGNDRESMAYRTGARGKIAGLINYMADLTIPYNGYVPYYVNKTYDVTREEQYTSEGLDFKEHEHFYLRGSAGFDLFRENLIFDLMISAEIDKSFSSITNPSMTAFLSLGEDLIPFFFFDASYTKDFDDDDDLNNFSDFLTGISEVKKNSRIEVNANIKYNVFMTQVGVNLYYDDKEELTRSVSVAGGIALDGLFGFL